MIQDKVLLNDWHVLALSEDIKPGDVRPARLLGEDVVLWRSADGEVHVWQDLCLHRGAKLSLGEVKENEIMCAYHGWTYGTHGGCTRIPAHPNQKPPAKAVVKTYHAKERYGWVWACLGEPEKDPPPFTEWDDDAYRSVHCGPYPVTASAPRLIENFLDVAHFPYVHGGYLGDPTYPEIADYEVETTPDGIVAKDITVYQPDPDGTGVGKDVTYTYKVLRPLTAYFVKTSDGPNFAMFFTITPVETTKSIAWMYVTMNYGQEMNPAEVSGFQDTIFSQDQPVVESQRPELLPLDLQAELHLKSDRTAIAYRKWLGEIGLTFGTS